MHGRGTELILAADYRLAADSPQTRLVSRGEIRTDPRLGRDATTAAARRIDAAIELITTGEPVVRRAVEVGLVFDAASRGPIDHGRDVFNRTSQRTGMAFLRRQQVNLSGLR